MGFIDLGVMADPMARKAQIDAPGALHHIVIRGIERKPIFKDSEDYQNFLELLDNILTDSSTPCYAWTLMRNMSICS